MSEIGFVFTLLPGLLTFIIVRTLTGRERKIDVTEATLHGLAYTLLTHALWELCKLPPTLIPTPDVVGLCLCSVLIGVLVSVSVKHRLAFGLMRYCGLTSEPEFPTVWETAFTLSSTELGDWVVIEFADGRRIMGAVKSVSPDHVEGHVCLQDARWLVSSSENPILLDGWFLTASKNIANIHFLNSKRVPDATIAK